MTASQMVKKGHSIAIASGSPLIGEKGLESTFDEYVFNNLPVFRYRHSSFHSVRGQCIMEAEHNNRMVRKWFKKLLHKFQPDLVHIFHLQRLSASILEACCDSGVPFLITATDFWLICPTTQLFLPDNSLCAGPEKRMANCAKHLATKVSNPLVGSVANKLPERLIVALLDLLSRNPCLRAGPFANLHALTQRPDYVIKHANRADRIIVTNQFMWNMLETHGIHAEKLSIMPFGIAPINTQLSSPPKERNALKIGFIGTLNFHKGAHILIQAVRALGKPNNVELALYGSRDQFPEYVRMLDEISAGDTRIRFKGTFAPDQIGRVLSGFDVLAVPSLWYENTPLILNQAQAARLPVIVTDLGGMNDIVEHGVNGFLFPPGGYTELASILETLSNMPEQLAMMRKKIRPPMFIDQYADSLENHYQDIITRGLVEQTS